MFRHEELYRLQLALESKISDDLALIKIWEEDINKNKNHHDNKYLIEAQENLIKDVELKEKLMEIRYKIPE